MKLTGKKLHRTIVAWCLGTVCAFSAAASVQAAEKIYFKYGLLNFSVRVSSLKKYATDGEVSDDLKGYLKFINADRQASFRKALTQKANISPVILSEFLKTKTGETILDGIGNTIAIERGSNGKYAIRGALVQAAAAPEGLTLINFLEKLPTDIEVDVSRGLVVAREVDNFMKATESLKSSVQNPSDRQTESQSPRDSHKSPNMRHGWKN